MNDFTLTQLKMIVERAVRPVPASKLRKRKLREELLAHVTGVFDEESTKVGDERIALQRTAERFGDPAELTGQLQESLPASDALHRLLDRAWFRPGEPPVRRVLRYGFWYALILALFLPIWPVWVQLSGVLARAGDWPVEDTLMGGPVLLFDVLYFACVFAILVWGLVRMENTMAARRSADQEWASLRIDEQGGAPA